MTYPRWHSHKTVEAFQIANVMHMSDGRAELTGEGYSIIVDYDYMEQHAPKIGGYWVRYASGSQTWHSKEYLENNYKRKRE